MTASTDRRERLVQSAVREISHIATLPEITLRIIDLVEDPRSTAKDLYSVISNDPALCSRILKVVNSSFYGLPGQIGSINRAIVMLGLNAVKNIAIAASLAKLFGGGELTSTFSARDLWLHSNECAAAAKVVTDELGLGMADEAFLAGLIHDLGIMVEMQFDRSKLIDAIEQIGVDDGGVPAMSLLEVEELNFGATHEDFGRALCERWKFPRQFVQACGSHHHVMDVPEEDRKLIAIIAAADRLACEYGKGFRLDIVDTAITEELRELLGLTAAKLETISERLPATMADAEANLH